MKESLSFFLTIIILTFTACSDDDEFRKGNIRLGSKKEKVQTFYADETIGTLDIEADYAWTSVINETTEGSTGTNPIWISINPYEGSATTGQRINITLTKNETGLERSAIITLRCNDDKQDIEITQLAVNGDGTMPNPGGPIPPADASLISRLTTRYVYAGQDDGEEVWTFSYDELRRIASAEYKEEREDYKKNESYDFIYSTNSIYLLINGNTEYGNPDEGMNEEVEREILVQIDSNSCILSGIAIEIKNNAVQVDTGEYRWIVSYYDNYITTASFEWQVENDTTETTWRLDYSWSDENLTGFEYRHDDYSYTSSRTYGEELNNENVNLDLNWAIYRSDWLSFGTDNYRIFNYMGAYGKRSTNMVATEEDGENAYSYAYTFDSSERISTVSIYYEGEIRAVISVTYN